jgi:hypothetical protein
MHIPSVDSDAKSSLNLTLSPKVVEIIEKMTLKPSLIEKLLLNSQNALLIDLAAAKVGQTLELKKISLPLKLSSELASISQSQTPINISLKVINNQVLLTLTTNEKSKNETLNFYFKNAKLQSDNLLKLTTPINTKLAKNESTNLNLHENRMQPSNTSSRSEASQLQQAISNFLKIKPVNEMPLSHGFNKLFELEQKFAKSFNQKINQSGTPNLQLPITTLNKSEINELLIKINQLLPEQKQAKDLTKLLTKVDNLKLELDFSKENKQLKLKDRMVSSGNFLEAKIAKADSSNLTTSLTPLATDSQTRQKSNTLNTVLNEKLNIENPINKCTVNTTNLFETKKENNELGRNAYETSIKQPKTDLKLSLLSIKQLVRSLLQTLSASNTSPIHSQSLIKLIAQHPELLQSINNSQLNKPTTGSEAPSPASLTTKKDSNSFFEKNLFSPQLKQTILNSMRPNLGNQAINLKQENYLLNFQKQILTEFLNETNSLLSKIETNQLLSLRSETSQQQQFLLDLPIYHNKQVESFELLFLSQQQKEKTQSNKKWTVTIKFDLEPLGPMFARVSLVDERISTHFFAKEAETAELLSNHLSQLKDSLFLAGLDIDEISGQQGVVPEQLLVNDEHSIDVRV